jgi:glycopeptide antibiotics resistance protein
VNAIRRDEAEPHRFAQVNEDHRGGEPPLGLAQAAGSVEVLRLWRLMLLASVVFVVYGSLVPLNFQPVPWEQAVARFFSFAAHELAGGSRVDKASNVLLTMPVAFAAAQWLLPGRSTAVALFFRVVIAAGVLLLSMGVEFAQLFLPSRTMSWSDVAAQSLGTLLGLAAQHRWGAAVSGWLLGWWRRERGSARLSRVLKAYLAVLLGFSLLPLDLTVNPFDLHQKWAEGRVILMPFAGFAGDLSERVYGGITDVAIWVPVGVFLYLSRPLGTLQIVLRGLWLAVAIELLQLFVFSRVTDVTDVLAAGLGVLLGSGFARWWRPAAEGGARRVNAGGWLMAWAAWLAVVLVVFWFPFNARVPVGVEWVSWWRVPFETYQLADEYRAVNEVLRRIGFFLPGGVLLFLTLHARARGRAGGVSGSAVFVLLLVAVVVEAGQLFLPGKVADLTDAGLGFLGGALGFRLARWLVSTAPSRPPLAPTPPRPAVSSKPPVPTANAVAPGGAGLHAWTVLGLALALSVAVTLPGMPYNLRELIAVGPWGLVSSLSLAVCLFLLANAPMVLWNRSPLWAAAAPFALALVGAFCYGLLRMGVPMESIFDVVGSPVLGWPWEWELLLRFMALWVAVGLQVGLACLLVAVFLAPRSLPAFINGLLVTALVAYPLYWAVVDRAATDNLVELMANQASFAAASWLALAAFGICLAASSLSVLVAEPGRWRGLVPLLMLGATLAPLGLIAGLEANVIKYGKVFSALQFLLSTDRTQYVTGATLWVRFTLALALLVCGLAALQHLGWRSALALNTNPPARSPRDVF